MQPVSLKSLFLSVHRWLGLVLAPLFLLIAISGGVLALKPILQDPMFAGRSGTVEATTLASALKAADPGGRANKLSLSADGTVMALESGNAAGPNGAFSVATGEPAAAAAAAGVPAASNAYDGVYNFAKSLHKDLLFGAGIVVLLASIAMLAIVVAGPVLGWLRFRNTLMGWHLAAGWIALPLVVLAPLTGVLMYFHIDTGSAPKLQRGAGPVAFAAGVESVAQNPDVSGISGVRRFKGGNVLIEAQTVNGSATFAVDGSLRAVAMSGPGLVKSLHEGLWAGAWSGLLNLAISMVISGLTITGVWSWLRRRRLSARRSGSADADILIAHASQTGTAAQLAEATLRALEGGGVKAACMSLSGIRPAELEQYRHVLLIVSTTGEGELAEPGRALLKALPGTNGLKASFAMLALGDSRYRQFCAGGELLRTALVDAGADERLAMVRADGAPQGAWREWLAMVEDALSIRVGEVEAPAADQPVSLTLIERTRLDNEAMPDTSETWQVVLAVEGAASFRPGDLLLLAPGAGETERCYSIGNSALLEQDRIVLTVSRTVWTDEDGTERYGRTSSLLCRELPVGARLDGAIRRHPHFNPPEDPATPIIMVATGCGVAPFTGFVAERSAAAGEDTGPAWLMFGNRYREGDFLYRDAWIDWQRKGALTQLSTAFSRDSDDGAYITEEIIANGDDIVALIRDRGGILYVCGRTRLGEGVESALVQALVANDNISEQEAMRTVQKWKAAGSLRQDLFD